MRVFALDCYSSQCDVRTRNIILYKYILYYIKRRSKFCIPMMIIIIIMNIKHSNMDWRIYRERDGERTDYTYYNIHHGLLFIL